MSTIFDCLPYLEKLAAEQRKNYPPEKEAKYKEWFDATYPNNPEWYEAFHPTSVGMKARSTVMGWIE